MVFQNTKCLKQEFIYISTSLSVREIPFKLKNSIRKSLTACIFLSVLPYRHRFVVVAQLLVQTLLLFSCLLALGFPIVSLFVDLYEKMFAADAFVLVLFLSTFLEFDSLEQF